MVLMTWRAVSISPWHGGGLAVWVKEGEPVTDMTVQ